MVASGLLTMFQPPAKGAEKATTSAFSDAKETPESAEAGRTFARMVQASASGSGQQERDPARTAAKPTADAQAAAAALVARAAGEMGLTPAQLARQVTPEQAADMLADFDAYRGMFGSASQDPQNQQQLKEQLLTIVETQEPKTVEEIIAAVEPAEAAADMAQGDIGDTGDGISVQAALAQTAQRVLTLFNKALSAPSTLSAEEPRAAKRDAEMAASAVNPALLAMHAGSFPFAAAQEAAQTPAAAALAADAGQTVTVITPLSQQTAIHSYAATAAAEVEDIAQAPVSAPQAIDSRIPSLALVKDKTALPEIDLPKAPLPAALAEAAPATAKPAVDIARQLETLGTAARILAADEKPVEAKPLAAANAAAAIAPMQAGTGTLSPHAIAPAAGVLGQGVINHAPVSNQVSVAIRKASQEGIDQITVQLDPLNLGRIEVKLHMQRDGHTQIAFMVDKPETFDALSRDARALEQSLQEAGIKADTSGMQFNLRQSPQQQLSDNQQGDNGHHGSAADTAPAEQAALAPEPTKTYRLDIRDGVDIQA